MSLFHWWKSFGGGQWFRKFQWDNWIWVFFGEKLDLGLIAILWWNFGPWSLAGVIGLRSFGFSWVSSWKRWRNSFLVFSATKHWVKESKEQMRLYGLSFWYFGYLLDLGMKKIYGLFFWFSWLPNTEWGRSMWLFLWIFLATKHKIINNFII